MALQKGRFAVTYQANATCLRLAALSTIACGLLMAPASGQAQPVDAVPLACPVPSAGVVDPRPETSYCLADPQPQQPAAESLAFSADFVLASGPVLPSAIANVTLQEINPDQSTLDPTDPDGASGGRVNGLASVAGDNQTFYAASEWGGLFQSTDGGLEWSHLDGHRPVATWDVEVDPGNAARVYATSFYDGRVTPLSGINVSTDSGVTWSRPASLTPWGAANCSTDRRNEPSAFGIGIRPDATNQVVIGTNCGVAISANSGANWTFVDPTPADAPADVWDVVVQGPGPSGNGIIDICGADGHLRSTDGGTTWTAGGALPLGRCSITASPDESYVLFVVAADNNIYESDDAGATWTNLGNRNAQGRIPVVQTNQRSDSGGNNVFDLWYGDVSLFRGTCTTPATPAQGGANRCGLPATWAGPFTRSAGAHDDAGDIVFDTAASADACPELFSSDGGVYYNTDNTGDCHNPNWEQPTVTPHAQWLFAFDGADQAGDTAEDLYYGTQDIGSFAATNAGASSPTWFNRDCCDVFDVAADSSRVLYSVCCFGGGGRANRLFLRSPGMTGGGEINRYPSVAGIPGFRPIDVVETFGDKMYVVVDATPGVYVTSDITASPIVWTQLGANLANACGVEVAVDSGGTPTFYVQTGICNERSMANNGDQLWKFVGTNPAGSWTRVDNNLGATSLGVGIFAVDPNDPARLYASNIRSVANGGPQMVFSTNGGSSWTNDAGLDAMMTGGGVFRYRTERGPSNFTAFLGYPQPTLVAFDPEDPDTLVAGGRDSGVFLSLDSGASWSLVSDPLDSHTSNIPHIPRPWFAYFDHEQVDVTNVYLGTQGRGVWRLTVDERATINVVKEVDEEPDGAFDDDPSGWTYLIDEDGNGQLDAGEQTDTTAATGLLSFKVLAGTYDVKETAGSAGFWLVTASCVDDDTGAPIGIGDIGAEFPGNVGVTGLNLAKEQSVTCTFSNARDEAFIHVVKRVDDEPDGVFDDDPSGWSFDVVDDAAPAQITTGTGMLTFVVRGGTYAVNETDPPAGDTGLWLVSASCRFDDTGAAVGTGAVDQLFGPALADVSVAGVAVVGGDEVTCSFDNQRMAGFLTGGGQIRSGPRKNPNFISFGGNVAVALDGRLFGHWSTVFHNVGKNILDKGHFHSTSIDSVVFGNLDALEPPDPPAAVFNSAEFRATGRFQGLICVLGVNATDHGEPARSGDPDAIRFRLDCPGTNSDYDSASEFASPQPLNGGNLQIHPPRE